MWTVAVNDNGAFVLCDEEDFGIGSITKIRSGERWDLSHLWFAVYIWLAAPIVYMYCIICTCLFPSVPMNIYN